MGAISKSRNHVASLFRLKAIKSSSIEIAIRNTLALNRMILKLHQAACQSPMFFQSVDLAMAKKVFKS